MINFRYQLVNPKKIEKIPFDESIDKKIVVKPTYMSICMADQRYYQGLRDLEILNKKLPLSLIHECVGEIVNSQDNEFKIGDKVILLPNINDNQLKDENYQPSSNFCSSSCDGFMQEYIITNPNQLIKYSGVDEKLMVMAELLSVAIHAVESNISQLSQANIIGIWGDGNLGYLLHLYLSHKWPNKQTIIYGTNDEKLNLFSEAARKINIFKHNILPVDFAFEAVGGSKSEKAIDQIIKTINPVGCIALLGVSEYPIQMNTRLLLEKGLTIIGRSRSAKEDFIKAKDFLNNHKNQNNIKRIINKEFIVNSIEDIDEAFNYDFTHDWKTIIKWEL